MRTAESGAREAAFKSFLSPTIAAAHSKWLRPTLKILFVKTSSLGDVVHNCPAVSDAARKIPGAEIDWVVEEPFAPIAAMHGAVRRVIPVRLRDWRRRWWRASAWREFRAFRDSLGATHYDAVIDTQSLIKSALVASCAHGRRHGLDRASAREPLAARFYDTTHPVARGLHAVERNRLLTAAALGYALDVDLDYGLCAIDAEPSAPYAVLLTMTSRDDKLWAEESWVELGKALATRIVLPWGNEAERARAARIAAALPDAQVAPRMTLPQLARLFARADGVVGVDTGLTHLAAALDARTVGIYCGSDPSLTGIYGAARARNVGALGRPPTPTEVLQALA
jgi:heptosyltransferase-1